MENLLKNQMESIYRGGVPPWHQLHPDQMIFSVLQKHNIRPVCVLDLGAGDGTNAGGLKKAFSCAVTAVDISELALSKLAERVPDAEIHCMDLREARLSSVLRRSSFDFGLSWGVLHFLITDEERQSHVRDLSACMAPGSHLLLMTFAYEPGSEGLSRSRIRKSQFTQADFRNSTREELIELHQEYFDIVDVSNVIKKFEGSSNHAYKEHLLLFRRKMFTQTPAGPSSPGPG